MTTLRVPYLPPELVEMILEEAYPGLRRQPPRIAPRWLVRLVGIDLLAWIDSTPAWNFVPACLPFSLVYFSGTMWRALHLQVFIAGPELTAIRVAGFVVCVLSLVGSDPLAASDDVFDFLAEEEIRDGEQQLRRPTRQDGEGARQRPWSDRLRARYRLHAGQSKLIIRLDLLLRLLHVVAVCLAYADILSSSAYATCGLAILGASCGAVWTAPNKVKVARMSLSVPLDLIIQFLGILLVTLVTHAT